MKEFKQFYVFGMTAKSYMGLYFAAIVFFVSLIRLCFGDWTLSILHLGEMLLVSFVVGFLQAILLPGSTDYSKGLFFGRSVIWLLISVTLAMGVSILGGWFVGLPGWCVLLMGGLMLVGFCAMLLGQRFEQDMDTLRLNDDLKRFQGR